MRLMIVKGTSASIKAVQGGKGKEKQHAWGGPYNDRLILAVSSLVAEHPRAAFKVNLHVPVETIVMTAFHL